jgi:hypothetical protein
MEYMILLYSDENFEMPAPDSPEFGEFMGQWMAYNQQLIDGGHWVAGASLQPTATATTVTKVFGGSPTISDGPYAETKEQIGGFYLVSADSLDQAIELAKAVPIPVGSFEVRPVAFRPDAA